MFLRKTWRVFGKESRRTSRLRDGEFVLCSDSSEDEFLAHTPTTSPSSSRPPSPSPPRSDIMESQEDSSTSGYTPSVPDASNYSTPQAGGHEHPAWINTTVSHPTEPTWGTVNPGPPPSMYNRGARLYGMGNNAPTAPGPAQYNGPYLPNPTWGSGASTAPSQEQLMSAIWQLAQNFRNNNLL